MEKEFFMKIKMNEQQKIAAINQIELIIIK